MFLISDKLEKLDSKYDLMKDEKRDLMKEENLNSVAAPKYFRKWHIFYSIIIGVVFFTFTWMMMSPKYNSYQLSQIEQQTLRVTTNVVSDARLLLNHIRERAATMSEQNKRAAAEYVAGVRDALRERTNVGVQKANQIVLDKIRDVENELTSFGFVIDDAVASFAEEADADIEHIRAWVAQAQSADAAQLLEAAIRQVEDEIRSMLTDVDRMYSYYGRYIGHIVEHSMRNATDRISIMLNAQRRDCDCTLVDRINMCYNISAQNGDVTKTLRSALAMVDIAQNTTDMVKGLEHIYADADRHSRTLFEESRDSLQKTVDSGKGAVDAILRDDSCFLGSTVRKFAYEDHATLKQFMVRGMKTVIESLARSLRHTLDGFEVVRPAHHGDQLVAGVEQRLSALANDMTAKASLIADAGQRAEYQRKASLDQLRAELKTKFANATDVVNTLFAENRDRLSDSLRYNLGYIVGRQLPYVSTLTIQNYIPSDVCPLSVDYQRYVATTLRDTVRKDDSEIIDELFDSANYYADDAETGAALASSNEYATAAPADDDSSAAPQQSDAEDAGDSTADENEVGTSSMLIALIQSIISTVNEAGYSVEGPVKIVVTDDAK